MDGVLGNLTDAFGKALVPGQASMTFGTNDLGRSCKLHSIAETLDSKTYTVIHSNNDTITAKTSLSLRMGPSAGLSVVKQRSLGHRPSDMIWLNSSSGAAIGFRASLFSELGSQMCSDGGIAMQASSWGVNKHACQGGEMMRTAFL
jgi:hypothetical protein